MNDSSYFVSTENLKKSMPSQKKDIKSLENQKNRIIKKFSLKEEEKDVEKISNKIDSLYNEIPLFLENLKNDKIVLFLENLDLYGINNLKDLYIFNNELNIILSKKEVTKKEKIIANRIFYSLYLSYLDREINILNSNHDMFYTLKKISRDFNKKKEEENFEKSIIKNLEQKKIDDINKKIFLKELILKFIEDPSVNLGNEIIKLTETRNDYQELNNDLLNKFQYYETKDKSLMKIIYQIIPHRIIKKKYYSLVNSK